MFKTKSPLPFIIMMVIIAIIAIVICFVVPALLGDPTVSSSNGVTTWSWGGSFEF